MTEPAYIPGICNINSAEVAYRRRAMWLGVGASAFVFVALILIRADWWLSIVCLFIPLYTACISYLQVRNRFCVGYGSSGLQNAQEGSTGASDVSDGESRRKDVAKTWRMNAQAFGMTISLLGVCIILFLYVF